MCRGAPVFCGSTVPLDCLTRVSTNTLPFGQGASKTALRKNISALCCPAEHLDGLMGIAEAGLLPFYRICAGRILQLLLPAGEDRPLPCEGRCGLC